MSAFSDAPQGVRILAGVPDSVAPAGAIFSLAMAVRGHAIAAGFRIISLRCSRVRGSPSKILTIADRKGATWLVRVSNHYLPRRTGHPEPHLDFVSRDGVSGLDRATRHLDRIAAGAIAWTAPKLRPRRKGVR